MQGKKNKTMSRMGKKGGKKSKRKLTPEQAREMANKRWSKKRKEK